MVITDEQEINNISSYHNSYACFNHSANSQKNDS